MCNPIDQITAVEQRAAASSEQRAHTRGPAGLALVRPASQRWASRQPHASRLNPVLINQNDEKARGTRLAPWTTPQQPLTKSELLGNLKASARLSSRRYPGSASRTNLQQHLAALGSTWQHLAAPGSTGRAAPADSTGSNWRPRPELERRQASWTPRRSSSP
ncbi:hypothetical protein E4U21_004939 [Claviceps maximensis]|nr:hypothetical protein E4U21_004939 [Claviceps maximensis]